MVNNSIAEYNSNFQKKQPNKSRKISFKGK